MIMTTTTKTTRTTNKMIKITLLKKLQLTVNKLRLNHTVELK